MTNVEIALVILTIVEFIILFDMNIRLNKLRDHFSRHKHSKQLKDAIIIDI